MYIDDVDTSGWWDNYHGDMDKAVPFMSGILSLPADQDGITSYIYDPEYHDVAICIKSHRVDCGRLFNWWKAYTDKPKAWRLYNRDMVFDFE